jgi:uncharacterized membrane protein
MQIEETIEIDAPASVVWSVTVDVENWPAWTPTVSSAKKEDDAQFQLGSVVSIKQPQLPETAWTVTDWTEGERFTWETRVRGITMVATHEIHPLDKRTRNVLRLVLKGFVARLLGPLIQAKTRAALQQENAGLKRQCESLHNS